MATQQQSAIRASVCLRVLHCCLPGLKIDWKFRKSEQNAKQYPKISVHDEVLVNSEAVKAHWEEQQKGVPENRKCEWKPHRSLQLLGSSPCGKSDRRGHENPQKEAYNPKLDHELAIPILDPNIHWLSMHNASYVLTPQRSGPDSVTVRPTGIVKRCNEILEGIVPRSITKFNCRTVRGKSFDVDRQSASDFVREYGDKNSKGYRDKNACPLDHSHHADSLTLPRGCTPDKGKH